MKNVLVSYLRDHWSSVSLTVLSLCALLVIWLVRDTPNQWLSVIRLDALSAFFLFATLAGLALVAWVNSSRLSVRRTCALLVALIIAYCVTFLPAIGIAYVVLALVMVPRRRSESREQRAGSREQRAGSRSQLSVVSDQELGDGDQGSGVTSQAVIPQSTIDNLKSKIPWSLPPQSIIDNLKSKISWLLVPGPWLIMLATGCLLVSYATLALQGLFRYDDRIAGSALNSFVFGFILLAATVPQLPIGSTETNDQLASVCRIAWLYPLVRLYSLGPWNTGWAFATLLFGAAALMWASTSALTEPHQSICRQRVLATYAALALASFGLGTGAGILAGCYGILTYLILNGYDSECPGSRGRGSMQGPGIRKSWNPGTLEPWTLSGALPFTAPFTAAWMLIGASTAGSVILLAGIAWLASLLNALTMALRAPFLSTHRTQRGVAVLSGLVGVGAPVVVFVLIEPIIEQLQGGLTPYGDINLWPWIGLAIRDSASTQITVLPSIAVAALMVVLAALVYLVVRLRETFRQTDRTSSSEPIQTANPSAPATPSQLRSLVAFLTSEVIWFDHRPTQRPRDEQPVDGE